MSIDRNKQIVRRALDEVFNAGKVEAVDGLYAPSFVNHVPPSMGPEIRGIDGVQRNIAVWRAAFPDLRFTLDGEIAEGEMVLSRWTAHGTHCGLLHGIPPSGREVTVSALELSRIAGNRIAEQWLLWDTLGLVTELQDTRRNER